MSDSTPKGNHFADMSAKNVTVKDTNSQTSVMVQRDIFLNDNLEKWQETPNNWPQKRKENNIGTQIIIGSIKKKDNSGLDQITIQPYTKFQNSHYLPLYLNWTIGLLTKW